MTARTVIIDGLSPSQKRISAATYSDSNILAVQVITKGSGNLTLSPLSGDADIVITATELTAMGNALFGNTFYGKYDSVTAGTAMELLAYIE